MFSWKKRSLSNSFNFAAKVGTSAVVGVLIKAGVVTGAGAAGLTAGYGIAIAAGAAALTNGAMTTFQFARSKDKKLWSKEYSKAMLIGMGTSALAGGTLSWLVPGLDNLMADAWHSETAESVRTFLAETFHTNGSEAGQLQAQEILETVADKTDHPDVQSSPAFSETAYPETAQSEPLPSPETEMIASSDAGIEQAPESPKPEYKSASDAFAPASEPMPEPELATQEISQRLEVEPTPSEPPAPVSESTQEMEIETQVEIQETETPPSEPSSPELVAPVSEPLAEPEFEREIVQEVETPPPPAPFTDWENLSEAELSDAVSQFLPEEKPPVLSDIMERMESGSETTRAQAVKDFAHGLYNGEYGLPENDEAAFAVNHVAVEISGGQNAQAVFNEAYSQLHGIGTDQDYEQARQGFEKARELGYLRACDYLNYMEDIGAIEDSSCPEEAVAVQPPPPSPEPAPALEPVQEPNLEQNLKPGPETSPYFNEAAENTKHKCFSVKRLNDLWNSWNPRGCLPAYAR